MSAQPPTKQNFGYRTRCPNLVKTFGGAPMGTYIGQTSKFQPAVVLDIYSENADGVFHMLFVSSDSSNRLLHTFSPGFGADEGTVWEPVPSNTGQTTHSAPALVIYRDFDGQAGI